MSEIVAKVNGVPVSAFDLNNTLQSFALEMHRQTFDRLPETEQASLRTMALEKLIARELIHQAALAQGLVATEEQVEAEMNRIIRGFKNQQEFYHKLHEAGLDPTGFKRMIRKDVTVNQMIERRLEEFPEPSPEEVDAFYDAHPELMEQPARVRASHILVEIDPAQPDIAWQTMLELKAKTAAEDFEALARLYSACPSAPGGGDLGFFRREEMSREFAEAAFSQPVGKVGEVIQTQFGYHLIKVTEHQPATVLSKAEARPKIVGFIRQREGAKRLEAWTAKLQEEAEVEIS